MYTRPLPIRQIAQITRIPVAIWCCKINNSLYSKKMHYDAAFFMLGQRHDLLCEIRFKYVGLNLFRIMEHVLKHF